MWLTFQLSFLPLTGSLLVYQTHVIRLGWGLSPGGDFGCCCLRLPTDSPPHTSPFWLRRCRVLHEQPLSPFPTHEMFNPSHLFNL